MSIYMSNAAIMFNALLHCTYVCIYVCMYVCMYVCVRVYACACDSVMSMAFLLAKRDDAVYADMFY
jgi:hypothetical protein